MRAYAYNHDMAAREEDGSPRAEHMDMKELRDIPVKLDEMSQRYRTFAKKLEIEKFSGTIYLDGINKLRSAIAELTVAANR